MKKQIFILVFVLFALGMTKSYGQGLAPRAITGLTSDALRPIAGQSYNYAITVPTPAGTKTYTWFVTQEPHFISAGVLTLTRETVGTGKLVYSTSTGYNNTGTPTDNIDITWKSFNYDPSLPVFVVIQVANTATTPDLCATKNMKVYKIVPQNAFTLDIANLDADATTPSTAGSASTGGYGSIISKCIHDIVDAAFDATAIEGVIYDFGTDYMFYEVVAANFNHSWKPSFNITGIDANETVNIDWSTNKAFPVGATTHALTAPTSPSTVWTSADVYTTSATGDMVGATGESIYVRITLDHSNATKTYQGLSDEPVVLAVDGTTNLDAASPALPLGDVHHSATVPIANTDLGLVDGYKYDIAYQTLKPRPTINAVSPALLPVKP